MEHLARLESFAEIVERLAGEVPEALHRTAPAAGGFSLVEHAHHLADLEALGFAVRIARLLAEDSPRLPDFDGARVAREGEYLARDAASGFARFARARRANVARLAALSAEERARGGTQDGAGPLTLADLPQRMHAHDCSHARELVELLAEIAPQLLPGSPLAELAREGGPCADAA